MNEQFIKYKNSVEEYISHLKYQNVPQLLKDAMSYTLNLPCKRVRAVLLLSAYNLLKSDYEKALPFATAIEMIHAYSLIHDDLPAMDNDSIRRGKPSNHIQFGEGIAILAGDALLNYAFEIMLDDCVHNKFNKNHIIAMKAMAERSGVSGMIAGQVIDISSNSHDDVADKLAYIHLHKTSDLIIASVSAGLYLAGASESQIKAGQKYALHLGLAFQIIDDILDYIGDSSMLGKSVGKDALNDKLSWVNVYGIEKARLDANMHTKLACESISNVFLGSEFFCNFANVLLERIK